MKGPEPCNSCRETNTLQGTHSGLCSTHCPAVLAATGNGRFLLARHQDKKKVMFSIIHMDGSGDDDPTIESLSELYDELSLSGITDGNVSVIHQDSGWCMS